ncbi:Uncharacterised protein [Cronobacter universalis NCTC 9529]|uniref:PheST operon leader peptide PheM n=1 Tax=Cronobacter universalis NCTC 9529 TaxID=1074000 RepID=A0ABY1W7U9_9ENTR|nr:Uncharacterised protein [Cronobacter universalis NCTC 9529]
MPPPAIFNHQFFYIQIVIFIVINKKTAFHFGVMK